MLYERWRQLAADRPREWALIDTGRQVRLTFAQLAAQAERDLPGFEPIVFPSGNSSEFVVSVLRGWRQGSVLVPLEAGEPAPVLRQRPPAPIVHLKSTSASTGRARLVAFTARQLLADAENIRSTMGLRPDWPNIGAISLAHSYGFSNLVLPLLLHGIPLFLVGSGLPEAVERALRDLGPVTLPAVPALWRAWHEAGAIPANVRLAISAGAPLPVALEQTVYDRFGLKIHNFYGATECGGIAYDRSSMPRSDPALVGSPMENVGLALNDTQCLRVSGDAVGEAYWPEPAAGLAGGHFQSSDLAELSGGGVFLRGRLGDQINVAGRKVTPETIERVLLAHPSVKTCVVFGVPSRSLERTEIIVACVAETPGMDRDGLKKFAVAHLPAWQVPRDWWIIRELEVNQRGKLSRAEWRERYLTSAQNTAER